VNSAIAYHAKGHDLRLAEGTGCSMVTSHDDWDEESRPFHLKIQTPEINLKGVEDWSGKKDIRV
jgi:hypothetical protein